MTGICSQKCLERHGKSCTNHVYRDPLQGWLNDTMPGLSPRPSGGNLGRTARFFCVRSSRRIMIGHVAYSDTQPILPSTTTSLVVRA